MESLSFLETNFYLLGIFQKIHCINLWLLCYVLWIKKYHYLFIVKLMLRETIPQNAVQEWKYFCTLKINTIYISDVNFIWLFEKNYWIVYDDHLIGSPERFRHWRTASAGVRAIDTTNATNHPQRLLPHWASSTAARGR